MRRLFFLVMAFVATGAAWASDFELSLGKGTPDWDHVRTVEDRRWVAFFKRLYEKNFNAPMRAEGGVPSVFHLVWLGPSPLPEESLARLERWHELHPDWTFCFWTDVQEAPLNWMAKRDVGEFDFTVLGPSYDFADNFREKAFLLALEILHAEGGIYLDHDVAPVQSVDFVRHYDFFASLAPLGKTIFSSSVYISPHVMAGCAGHPFFAQAMQWYKQHGVKYRRFIPGTTPADCIYRTQVRMYEALRMGARKGLNKGSFRDSVFPPKAMDGVAVHRAVGSWKEIETLGEKKLKQKIDGIGRQIPISLTLILVAIGMIPLTWVAILRRRT